MASSPIYLDNNATTRPDPRVIEALLPYLTEIYGNAASHGHAYGWQAEQAVDIGRAQVAALIGADPREIVFTSGATEANNLALKGVMEMYADRGDHLITQVTEHKAILDTAHHLERLGKRVTYLGVDPYGQIDLDALKEAFTDQTVLVSIMLANNETGTLQKIQEIAQLCRERRVLFHTDATQAVGKVPIQVGPLGIDLMSFAAHKMHGPKGIGALYVRRRAPRVRLTEQMNGGGHEHGQRSGTLNVPGIVGFGKAAELYQTTMTDEAAHTFALRERLYYGLTDALPGITLNGHPTERLPNTLNLRFEGVEAEALLANLPDVALSTGSACTSASIKPSHVLIGMGQTAEQTRSAVRFGTSRFTTEHEIDSVIPKIIAAVERLRAQTETLAPANLLIGGRV